MFNYKNSKAGFTLVEIIIVIVIVAILAAIAVPTMLGFVKKANEQQYIAEARTVLAVAEAVFIEKFAKDPKTTYLEEKDILPYIEDEEIKNDKSLYITVLIINGKIAILDYERGGYSIKINTLTKEVTINKQN